MEDKVSTLGKNLKSLFDTSRYLDVYLDNEGAENGSFEGQVPPSAGLTSMLLGNQMRTEYIVHEWGHALDREFALKFSGNLKAPLQGIYSIFRPPNSDEVSIFGTMQTIDIIGEYCQPGLADKQIILDYSGVQIIINNYVLSGVPKAAPGIFQRCLTGYGDIGNPRRNEDILFEDWADLFMNWVYDNRTGTIGGKAGFSNATNTIAAASRRVWTDNIARLNFS